MSDRLHLYEIEIDRANPPEDEPSSKKAFVVAAHLVDAVATFNGQCPIGVLDRIKIIEWPVTVTDAAWPGLIAEG